MGFCVLLHISISAAIIVFQLADQILLFSENSYMVEKNVFVL